ncbi:MAG: hypothetical protein COS88_00315, partial [Chloroflexi bacterium CG07_land_8_20_14_0_80_51_10]
MNPFREFNRMLGLFLFALVLIILLAMSGSFFSRGVYFIYTNLSNPGDNQVFVRTKMDLGNSESVGKFPREMGDWKGPDDFSVSAVKESLGADVMLLRPYIRPGLYRPLEFLIMQSKDRSSFHPPEVCYPALGYQIEEEGNEAVPIPSASWVEGSPWDPQLRTGSEEPARPVPTRKLVITKGADGEVKERKVVLYFYVKESSFWARSGAITMIRVSGAVPANGSYEGMLSIEKDFIAEVVPRLFEAR